MKLTKQIIKKIVKEEIKMLKEEKYDPNWINPDHDYAVLEKGGSIGSKRLSIKGLRIIQTFDNKSDATIYAKRRTAGLSPGERKYYGMGYVVVTLTPTQKKQLFN